MTLLTPVYFTQLLYISIGYMSYRTKSKNLRIQLANTYIDMSWKSSFISVVQLKL